MIGILLLGQQGITEGLLEAARHVLGKLPPQLTAEAVDYSRPVDEIERKITAAIGRADQGEGVLILADIYGATHVNLACRQLVPGRIELVAGVNLPMLLRVLNYAPQSLAALVDTARDGGAAGIVCPSTPSKKGKAS